MVATPIGNLQDITLRALEILKSVDVIAAEDTRHTAGLLGHFGIHTKLVALHQHNERVAGEKLVAMLASGQSVALVSDAGTPGISDPGTIVVEMARAAGIQVSPIPGACAAAAAISAAGFADGRFHFYGFLPASNSARRHALESLREQAGTLVFYEAPHRVLESVIAMAEILGAERQFVMARELTKTFETFYRCKLGEAHDWLAADANQQRGEFVLLIEGATAIDEQEISDETLRVLALLLQELPLKQAVKLATDITGVKKNALYARALELKSTS